MLLRQSDTDDKGYSLNGLMSYNFVANKEYTIRVHFYSSSTSGDVRLGIISTYYEENYEDFYGPYGLTTVSWSLPTDKVGIFKLELKT